MDVILLAQENARIHVVSIVQLAVLIHAKCVAITTPVKPFAKWGVFIIAQAIVVVHVMELVLELQT